MFPEKTCLAHRVASERVGSVRVTTFDQWPITIERPERGAVAGTVRCGTCRQPIRITVSSAAGRAVRKAVYAVIGVAGLVAFVATVAYFVNAPVRDEGIPSSLEGPPAGLLVLGLIGGALAAIVGLVFTVHEDGTRMKLTGQPGHSIRRAKARPGGR